MITTRQVKAARALLGWSQADLASHSGISEPTVARLESMDGELGGRVGTAEKIRRAIVAAAQPPADGETVFARQHQVEHEQIERASCRERV